MDAPVHTTSPPDTEPLLTEAEAAELLSLSVRTLQAWRYDNSGPRYCRLGRQIRYRRADLLAWIEARTPESSLVREGAL
ncbi:MAG: helix-turn-helix domain-containing protein [Parafilimonas terrae]|nr:helix-turn-helix domain-containing protein [Parafilimonas terrae]